MGKAKRTEYAVLAVLRTRPMSGYEIKKFIESSIGYFWHENYGSIYPTLNQMEKNNLVTKDIKENDSGPSSNVYTLTQRGTERLHSWILEDPKPIPSRDELLFKLFLGDMISVKDNEKRIKKYKEKNISLLDSLVEIEKCVRLSIEQNPDRRREQTYKLMTIRKGVHQAKSNISWCDECLETLNALNENF